MMKSSIRALSLGIVTTLILCASLHAQIPDRAPGPGKAQSHKIDVADHLVASTNDWLRWYGALPPAWRGVLEKAAVSIASFRGPALKYLIVHAPERALDRRLGHIDRVSLPPKVTAVLETLVDALGDYQAPAYLHRFDPQTGAMTAVLQAPLLQIGDEQYPEPKLYGRRIGQASKVGLPVHGIAIDDALAWSEEPFRRLDPVELESVQLPPDTIAIFSGGKILPIDSEEELENIGASLRAREELPGPFLAEGAIDDILIRAWTHGPKNILWIPVDFDEAPGSLFEESSITDAIIENADTWIRHASRERTSVSVTYFPGVLRLPAGSLERALEPLRASMRNFPYSIVDDTETALAEYDRTHGGTGQWLPESYDRLAIIVNDAVHYGDGGGGSFTRHNWKMVFFGNSVDLNINHELGHSHLFGHSLYSVSSTSDPLGPPSYTVGMLYDYMGQPRGSLAGDHINHPPSSAKEQAYWMESTAICTDATDPLPEVCDARFGGSFRLVAHDNGPDGLLRALKIPTADRIYWVSLRRLWPLQPWVNNGVQIHYTPVRRNPAYVTGNGLGGATYIGLRNADPEPHRVSPFQPGEALEDAERGVRIRIDSTGEEAGVAFAEVTVENF